MHPPELRDLASRRRQAGDTWSSISRDLGVSRSTLRAWARAPEPRRGECPPCHGATLDGAAYAALLGFYLGDGCLSAHPRCFALRVACDLRHPGIVEDVEHCIMRVRPGARVFRVPAQGCVQVTSLWQHWPCVFPQHGPGRKHERDVSLHDWQEAVAERHPEHLLRGLFHSDGCRTTNWARVPRGGEVRTYRYPRWHFDNRSENVIDTCTWALDLVGIPWRRSNRHTVSVSRREAVAALDALIGPKS